MSIYFLLIRLTIFCRSEVSLSEPPDVGSIGWVRKNFKLGQDFAPCHGFERNLTLRLLAKPRDFCTHLLTLLKSVSPGRLVPDIYV